MVPSSFLAPPKSSVTNTVTAEFKVNSTCAYIRSIRNYGTLIIATRALYARNSTPPLNFRLSFRRGKKKPIIGYSYIQLGIRVV